MTDKSGKIYGARMRAIAGVLKKKHPNYTVNETIDLAEEIIRAEDTAVENLEASNGS